MRSEFSLHAAAAFTPGATPAPRAQLWWRYETETGSWTFFKKKQCEARVFPRVLTSEGREGRWGVKYLTDKGGAMALEMLYLCKPRDVLKERVCVRGD